MKNIQSQHWATTINRLVLSTALGMASLLPMSVMAQSDRTAFQLQCVKAAISKVTHNAPILESKDIQIDAPSIAEDGSEVKVSVITDKLKNVEQISLFAEKNPTPLVASYSMPKGVALQVGSRIKMRGSQDIVAIVKADGKFYRSRKHIKITIGGCGGGSATTVTSSSKKHCH